jgi:hypothetical protein
MAVIDMIFSAGVSVCDRIINLSRSDLSKIIEERGIPNSEMRYFFIYIRPSNSIEAGNISSMRIFQNDLIYLINEFLINRFQEIPKEIVFRR